MVEAMGPRMSDPNRLVPELQQVAGALYRATGNDSVPQTTIGLVHLRVSHIVGNTYMTLRHTAALRKAGESEQRIAAVASWWDAPHFTAAERAALALVEAVFQPSARGERVPDELYAEASKHYDEKALATLMIAIGQAGFWLAVALIAKPVPGVPDSESWKALTHTA